MAKQRQTGGKSIRPLFLVFPALLSEKHPQKKEEKEKFSLWKVTLTKEGKRSRIASGLKKFVF
ncbi:MAG: hypothetical protein IJC85_07445 [Oscillospiraceae bacterium]|nr:hypothetical protein [Oscillospiraceae bacterium]